MWLISIPKTILFSHALCELCFPLYTQDHLDNLDSQDFLECKVEKEKKVQEDILDTLDLKEIEDGQDQKGIAVGDHLDHKGLLAQKEKLDSVVKLGYKAMKYY